MGDIYGGSRLTAPHTVTTIDASLGEQSTLLTSPQVVAIYAEGGDAEILFTEDTTAVTAGNGWIIKSGESIQLVVQSSKPYLHVVMGGTVRYFLG